MKKLLSILTLVILAASCGQQSDTCTIKGTVKGEYQADGAQLRIAVQGGERSEVALAEDGTFTYSCPANVTVPMRIALFEKDEFRPKYVAELVPEGGTIRVTLGETPVIKGGPVNREMNRFNKIAASIGEEFRKLDESETQNLDAEQALIDKMNAYCEKAFRANTDNWVGMMALSTSIYELSLAELDEHLEAAGDFIRENKRIQAIREGKVAEESTAEGKPFVDFTGKTPDGKTTSLSDYVGQGNYTLVDIWASWCAPCRQEMPNIRELWETYAGRGLQVVSVAVWDGDNSGSRKAIEEMGMAWNHIFVGLDRTPTELYGIEGIPHLILFAPDGTIYRRGLRGDTLKDTVSELYN